MQNRLETSAIAAATSVAEAHGHECGAPEVLARGSNTLIHLRPHPLVARVATGTSRVRSGSAWLQREIEVAAWLAERHAPTVRPSMLLPPVVHRADGFSLTFWPLLPPPVESVELMEAAMALRRCHESLADFEGKLPPLAILRETESLLSHPLVVSVLADDALALLRGAASRIAAEIELRRPALRPVHGDAHLANCWHDGTHAVWGDWEDAHLAPPEWDLACLTWRLRLAGEDDRLERTFEVFGAPVDRAIFELLVDARLVQAAVWRAILRGERTLPPNAAERLRSRAA